jgi:hypothetical protein
MGSYTSAFDGELIGNSTANINSDIRFNAAVTLGAFAHNNNRLVFDAAAIPNHAFTIASGASPVLGPVYIKYGNTVTVQSDSLVQQDDAQALTLEGRTTTPPAASDGAALDIKKGIWRMGSVGSGNVTLTPYRFEGFNGTLNLGVGTKLECVDVALAGNTFNVNNNVDINSISAPMSEKPWSYITASGDVSIDGDVNFDAANPANLPYLMLEMARDSGNQNLTTGQAIGSITIFTGSHTYLQSDLIVRGAVTIHYASISPNSPTQYPLPPTDTGSPQSENGMLYADNHNITVRAGLAGTRNLAAAVLNGNDSINYGLWEVINAPYPPVPYPAVPKWYAFMQNEDKKVTFEKDQQASADPVYFEIIGNTIWQEFECREAGAVIQFSRHPDQHIVCKKFSIHGTDSADHSGYVTITRLPRNTSQQQIPNQNQWDEDFPYIYDQSTAPSNTLGDMLPMGLPAYPPPSSLKNDATNEKYKYWNFNLISGAQPLEYFRNVKIYFSHAFNQRIPIETQNMGLEATPYYQSNPRKGYFNYDWIELKKILYSFTEDSDGDGRVDRIRVQSNVFLNGIFTNFDVSVDGYEIDRGRGENGFDLVSNITGDPDDKDMFYIHLKPNPEIDGNRTPLWDVIRNDESLKDSVTGNSMVGDPEIDRRIQSFDTVPPRIAYSVTLPGNKETYVHMSEPVVPENSGTSPLDIFDGSSYLDGVSVIDTTPPFTFTWEYINWDGTIRNPYPLLLDGGNLSYLLKLKNSYGITNLATLSPLYNAPSPAPSAGDPYFTAVDLVDRAQRAMDWTDPAVNKVEFIYYRPPKYPLDWNYSAYAKVIGNSHLRGYGLVTPQEPGDPVDFKEDEADAIKGNGDKIPITEAFVPPHKMLTVPMMAKLHDYGAAPNQNNLVKPADFVSPNVVTRRVTDVLVSLEPGKDVSSSGYFAWPVWARYNPAANPDLINPPADSFWGRQDTDNGIIWEFDGTKFLEERTTDIQARLNPELENLGLGVDLFFAANVPAGSRNPKETAARAKGSGGLWLPSYDIARPSSQARFRFYYMTPFFNGAQEPQSKAETPRLFTFTLGKDQPGFDSGVKLDFVLRLRGAQQDEDMFVARLDAPRGTVPVNWYRLVKPFSFDIQDVRLQRGGVTILNNVINSNDRETTFIRYHLLRPGRVTIQIFTLDGTLVKSLRRNEYRAAGEWTDAWNGTNNGGRPVARGLYFVRVVGPDIDEIRKVMVVK